MLRQKTISKSVSFTGVGLHSGEKVSVTLAPSMPNRGIVFFKEDKNGERFTIPLDPFSITDTQLCTALENEGQKVKTIEHFLAALSILGIDNLSVYMDGSEMPILDGSASGFLHLIREAGISELSAPKKIIKITDTFEFHHEDKFVKIAPSDKFSMDFEINFDNPAIANTEQRVITDFSDAKEVKDIMRSRTFGFIDEIEYLQSIGLVKGGSMDNAIVLDKYKVLNLDGLRCQNEFVNHKILDAIGDLYVCGMPIVGKLTAYKTGHFVNNQFLRNLLSSESYVILTEDSLDNSNAELPVNEGVFAF